MAEPKHIAVMTHEVIEALQPLPGGIYIDGTLGGATHTRALLQSSAPEGRVLSIELDPDTIERARQSLAPYGNRSIIVQGNFKRLDDIAKTHRFVPADGIILDLGLSSDMLEHPKKGLSFQSDGPLDMRFGPDANDDDLTAAEIVNSWPESDIEHILREYGEETHSRRIAKGIVDARKHARIIGTFDLVSVIRKHVPNSLHAKIHPATKTFQALRIAVNDELKNLERAISAAAKVLKPGSRLAIITFHSLEDRIVKHAFRESPWHMIAKKPITPSDTEIADNPRARSAKLRIAHV